VPHAPLFAPLKWSNELSDFRLLHFSDKSQWAKLFNGTRKLMAAWLVVIEYAYCGSFY
jgi:hypothetical protein